MQEHILSIHTRWASGFELKVQNIFFLKVVIQHFKNRGNGE